MRGRWPPLGMVSKSVEKQSIVKVEGADLKQMYYKAKHFEACRAGFGEKVLKNKTF